MFKFKQFQAWLWSDKIIYKKESRRLRNEQNSLTNDLNKIKDIINLPISLAQKVKEIEEVLKEKE